MSDETKDEQEVERAAVFADPSYFFVMGLGMVDLGEGSVLGWKILSSGKNEEAFQKTPAEFLKRGYRKIMLVCANFEDGTIKTIKVWEPEPEEPPGDEAEDS